MNGGRLLSERYREAQTYWKEKLADKVEPLSFYGTARDQTGTRVRRMSYDIGVGRTRELKRIARRPDIAAKTENAAMFNIFAALLFVYLHRITGNSRPSIGTPYHNRRSIEFKNTPGLFMEVLPLRMNIEEVDTFVGLIQRVGVEASSASGLLRASATLPENKKYEVLLNYHTAGLTILPGFDPQDWVYSGHENDSLALQVHDFSGSGSLVIDFDFHSMYSTRINALRPFITFCKFWTLSWRNRTRRWMGRACSRPRKKGVLWLSSIRPTLHFRSSLVCTRAV